MNQTTRQIIVVFSLAAIATGFYFTVFEKKAGSQALKQPSIESKVSSEKRVNNIHETGASQSAARGSSQNTQAIGLPTGNPVISAKPPAAGAGAALRYGMLHYRYADALAAIGADSTLTPGERASASALIMNACAFLMRMPKPLPPVMSSGDASFEVRKKAFENYERQVSKDRCDRLNPNDYSAAEVKLKWEQAAKFGDMRGLAAMVDYNLRRPENVAHNLKVGGSSISIAKGPTEQETQSLLAGLSSRDPAFIASFGQVLFETFADVDFVLGPRGEKLGVEDVYMFWNLVACSFGADCGASNRSLAAECSELGKCGAHSLEDSIRMYDLPADQWERYQRLVPLVVRAIETGDWTNVVTRRSPPSDIGTPFYDRPPFNGRIRPLPG